MNQYLNHHEQVKVSGRHSTVEVHKLQLAMEWRRLSRNESRREAELQLSQVARARGGVYLDDSSAGVKDAFGDSSVSRMAGV